MYRYFLVDAATSLKGQEVFPASNTWARCMNSGRGGRSTFVLGSSEDAVDGPVWNSLFHPLTSWLVTEYLGEVVYAGLIITDSYTWSTKMLTITHNDFWWLLARRVVSEVKDKTITKAKLSYTGLSPETLAKRAMRAGVYGPGYDLPLEFPFDVAGTMDRVFYGYNVELVSEVFQEAIDMDQGTNIDFRPHWNGDKLEFVLVYSEPTKTMEWDLDAKDSGVLEATQRRDATETVTRMYGVGEGSEADMLMASFPGSNAVSPLVLEGVEVFKEATTQAVLDARTKGALASRNRVVKQLDLSMRASAPYPVNVYRLGDTVRIKAKSDPYLSNDWEEWELMEFSGSIQDELSIAIRPKE